MSENFTCIDAVIVTMALYMKSNYELMFLGSWGFEYKPKKRNADTFGEKIFFGFKLRTREAISLYHGINLNWCAVDCFEQLLDKIKNQLNFKMPIGIFIDSFYCPWNPAYSKFHIDHYCLVVGYDELTNELICIDAYFSKTPLNLPIENLKNGYKEFISFSKKEQTRKTVSLKDILYENLFTMENKTYYEAEFYNMFLFADDIFLFLDINKEVEKFNGDIQNSLLFRQINSIAKYRNKFAISLRHLANNYKQKDLEFIANEMDDIGNQWNTVNLLLFKLFYTKKELIKLKISELIKCLAKKEKNVVNKLIKIHENL